jgi:bifunctional enzyme CysN/CysC
MRPGARLVVKHTTRTARAIVEDLRYRLDVNTLHRDIGATELGLNDIGRITLRLSVPLIVDPYRRNRATGSFILVDEARNDTVAGGMILHPAADQRPISEGVVWERSGITRRERWTATGLRGATIWMTGLPASGKSTLAAAVEQQLIEMRRPAYRLDGDNLRHGLNGDLGFDRASRDENVRRAGEVARLMADSGLITIVSLISPYAEGRASAREAHEEADLPFVEVWVSTPVEECEKRDPKGLYARARRGELTGFTGVDDPYEAPESPDLEVQPGTASFADDVERVLELLRERGVIE